MENAARLNAAKPKMRHLIFVVALLAVGAGVAAGLYLWLGDGGESLRAVRAVQIAYPEGWTEQPLTQADRQAGLLFKLERGAPAASFLGRTVVARLAADFDVYKLADDTQVALGSEIEGFDMVSRSVLQVGPYDTVRVYYRQAAPEGEPEYQTLMTIVPTPVQTFYLTLRAENDDFSRVEAQGLQIIENFVAYVSSVR